jgi:hypothetical protein
MKRAMKRGDDTAEPNRVRESDGDARTGAIATAARLCDDRSRPSEEPPGRRDCSRRRDVLVEEARDPSLVTDTDNREKEHRLGSTRLWHAISDQELWGMLTEGGTWKRSYWVVRA